MMRLIRELAEYERAADEVSVDVRQLEQDGFGEDPAYWALVAEADGKTVGMALYYRKYSTWKGPCIYLEDLVVTQNERGNGFGKQLFEAMMHVAKESRAGRMEWQVLDWNRSAIDFYKSYGAELDGEWLNGRLTFEQLQRS